jgi:acetoin utilization protein AcuB
MLVSEIMTAKPITVGLDDSLRVAIARMRDYNCRRLPVLNSSGALAGIITDRDTRLALHSPFTLHEEWEHEKLLDSVRVRIAMTAAPITVEPTTDVIEAVRLMTTCQIGGLPVLWDETLVGIVTSSDVMMAFVRHLRSEEHTVQMLKRS